MSLLLSNVTPLNQLISVAAERRTTLFLRTPKGQVLVVFLALLAIAGPAEGSRATLALHVLGAVLAACLVDLPFMRAETRRWQVPTSALLTGLIVAMILAPGAPWYVGMLASSAGILGKQLIRTEREHLFNPAALGLLFVGVAFGSGESWWGALANVPWPWLAVLLLGGAFITDRLNKFPLLLAFGGAYFGLWTLVSYLDPRAAAELFRAPFLQAALFLAFFMLTDPPTSPNRYGDQVWFGLVAAVVACAAALLGAGQLFLLVGVLAANAWLGARRLRQRATIITALCSR
ncbi:MAG: RnfABCDGE type electron transport complex subunit D [Chloroflexi bacterium]|nr:RnfABCDGE type electron transport complex subunit D [Chloroflexota bacterium]